MLYPLRLFLKRILFYREKFRSLPDSPLLGSAQQTKSDQRPLAWIAAHISSRKPPFKGHFENDAMRYLYVDILQGISDLERLEGELHNMMSFPPPRPSALTPPISRFSPVFIDYWGIDRWLFWVANWRSLHGPANRLGIDGLPTRLLYRPLRAS